MPTLDDLKVVGHMSTRMNFGAHFLEAAARAAARILAEEKKHSGDELGEFWNAILQDAFVVATMSVGCLENYANELFFEGTFLPNVEPPRAREAINALIDRQDMIAKYQTALEIRAGKKLEKGKEPFQSTQALIDLRNAVVHYRSEWSHQQGGHAKLSATLKTLFDPSEFLPGESFFPRAWASGSFAIWSVRTTYAFIDSFYAEAGEENPLKQHRGRIEVAAGFSLS